MPISVLATRCRHCGETVGRPKKEEERLTIDDLGGEQSATYTLSGNVTDALEAYRAEEISALEAKRQQQEAKGLSWFGQQKRTDSASPVESKSDLPELDAESRTMAESLGSELSSSTVRRRPPQPAGPTVTRKLFTACAIVAGLVLIYWGADKAYSAFTAGPTGPKEPEYENRALNMLEEGRPPIEALEEAMAALQINQSDRDRQIAEEVREQVIAQVESILTEPEWSRAQHEEAAAIVSRAAVVDTSPAILELSAHLDREVAAYKLVLTDVDTEADTATFKLNDPAVEETEQTVKEGDFVADRFLVKSISRQSVRLLDQEVPTDRGYRRLVARLMTPIMGS